MLLLVMSVNLIITTYAGKINKFNFNSKKDKYLKYNLQILNYLNFDLDQITIMKPSINKEHQEIKDYYDFTNLSIPNIINKIKIIECVNKGISYGQLFNAIHNNRNFDYHIFIEDDYLFFNKNSIKSLLNEFKKNKDSLLCSFIYKNRKWNLLQHAQKLNESIDTLKKLKIKLNNLNINSNNQYIIPDFSLCILSKTTVNKIFNRFQYYQLYDLFSISYKSIWLHQIFFGLILYESNIKIYDIQDNFINIFYNTGNNSITLTNNNQNINMNQIQKLIKKKLNSPIFIPLDVFIFDKFNQNMKLISSISNNSKQFLEDYVNIKKNFKL
jgi:hypothetical protein